MFYVLIYNNLSLLIENIRDIYFLNKIANRITNIGVYHCTSIQYNKKGGGYMEDTWKLSKMIPCKTGCRYRNANGESLFRANRQGLR